MKSASEVAFDLVVVGELNPDVIVHQPGLQPSFGQVELIVDQIRLEIGSSSAIVACGAARLGLRVAFVGVVGDDPFGRYVLGGLADRGVDVSSCRVARHSPTGATVILSRGDDRAIMTAPGAMDELTVADVPRRLMADTRHLHVGGFFLQPRLASQLPDLFASARRSGVRTSLDTNWDPSGRWRGLAPVLRMTDLFLPNAAELGSLTGDGDPASSARSLVGLVAPGGTIAVKRGREGGLAVRGDELVACGAAPVEVVDATGAGDSFDAGMIAGLLDGLSLADALRLAVACGSLSVRTVGGTRAQPSRGEAAAAAAMLAADGPTGIIDRPHSLKSGASSVSRRKTAAHFGPAQRKTKRS